MKRSFWAAGAFLLAMSQGALAQDAAMKICGDKWQAAKAAGTTQGETWPKFLAECRAGLPTAAPAAVDKPAAPAKVDPPVAGVKTAAIPVFPAAVASKFANLRPGQARQKTCSEQFRANKANGGNAGLRWQEKGGGYWSLCNKKLKGA